jgi:hypothetical protein
MRRWLISFCCYVAAIAVTIACVLSLGWICDYLFSPIFSQIAFLVLVVFAFTWLAYDHKRMRIWRYETGLPGKSSVLFFFLILFIWTIVVPWYLGLRFSILMGVARLRDEYKPWRMSDAQIGENGLVQPWRGRKL